VSSIFSDPFFRRGSTLLDGDTIELNVAGNPVAGGEVIGQVKAFQDCSPTGLGERHSNRLVYCVAARYTGSSNLTSADAGKLMVFDTASVLSEFKAAATTSNAAAGQAVGALDEYIPENVTVRPNDICWIVVKGPTTVNQTAAAINQGGVCQVSTTGGSVIASGSGAIVGQKLAATSSAAAGVRVNLISSHI
jgi:hypothetical protein